VRDPREISQETSNSPDLHSDWQGHRHDLFLACGNPRWAHNVKGLHDSRARLGITGVSVVVGLQALVSIPDGTVSKPVLVLVGGAFTVLASLTWPLVHNEFLSFMSRRNRRELQAKLKGNLLPEERRRILAEIRCHREYEVRLIRSRLALYDPLFDSGCCEESARPKSADVPQEGRQIGRGSAGSG
jgi:hypothetical protein